MRFSRALLHCLVYAAPLCAAACDLTGPPAAKMVDRVEIVQLERDTASDGLSGELVLRAVRDSSDTHAVYIVGAAGVALDLRLAAGDGSLESTRLVTDAAGIARVRYEFHSFGTKVLEIRAQRLPSTVMDTFMLNPSPHVNIAEDSLHFAGEGCALDLFAGVWDYRGDIVIGATVRFAAVEPDVLSFPLPLNTTSGTYRGMHTGLRAERASAATAVVARYGRSADTVWVSVGAGRRHVEAQPAVRLGTQPVTFEVHSACPEEHNTWDLYDPVHVDSLVSLTPDFLTIGAGPRDTAWSRATYDLVGVKPGTASVEAWLQGDYADTLTVQVSDTASATAE